MITLAAIGAITLCWLSILAWWTWGSGGKPGGKPGSKNDIATRGLEEDLKTREGKPVSNRHPLDWGSKEENPKPPRAAS